MVERLPAISVCIPTYNGAKYIAQTIESILNQRSQTLKSLFQTMDLQIRLLKLLVRLTTQELFVLTVYQKLAPKLIGIMLSQPQVLR